MTEAAERETKEVAIHLECELDEPIQKVWRALQDPEILARWLLPGPARIEPGGVAALSGWSEAGGRIECEVVESDPPRRLSLRWREQGASGGIDTNVTFELEDAGGSTRLRIVHGGFVVAADHPVDRVEESETVLVLLPPVARRKVCRPRPAVFHRGAMPVVMRLAA